jgi:membrane associated rhomboid family serine protease
VSTLATRNRIGVLGASFSLALLVGLLWLLEGVDQASGNSLDRYGIQPRTGEGLFEVFTAPFLHVGWAHLAANTIPFFVLGVIVLLDGWRQWLTVTLWVVVASGATVWLIAPAGSMTLGASGVVFGWLTYLMVRGLYTRAPGQVALGVVLLLFYGGLLLGVLPTDTGVSWQAHLGGAIGGVLAAGRQRRRPVDARWE